MRPRRGTWRRDADGVTVYVGPVGARYVTYVEPGRPTWVWTVPISAFLARFTSEVAA